MVLRAVEILIPPSRLRDLQVWLKKNPQRELGAFSDAKRALNRTKKIRDETLLD
jgi:hypothetical protein